MTPAAGAQWAIRHGDQRAVVVEIGGGLRQYEAIGRPLVAGGGEDAPAPHSTGLPLIPWPNRLRDGRHTFDGQEHRREITEPARGNAIHGLTRGLAGTLAGREAAALAVTCLLDAPPGYRFRLLSSSRYALAFAGLEVQMAFENVGPRRLPVGAGARPHLRGGNPPADGWRLRLPASRSLELDDRLIPTGREPQVAGTELDFRVECLIGGTVLDHAFFDLERGSDGLARVSLRAAAAAGLTLWTDASAPYVHVYSGEAIGRTGVAVEPMTCPANAFQSGTGLRVLEPGERWSFRWGIQPER